VPEEETRDINTAMKEQTAVSRGNKEFYFAKGRNFLNVQSKHGLAKEKPTLKFKEERSGC